MLLIGISILEICTSQMQFQTTTFASKATAMLVTKANSKFLDVALLATPGADVGLAGAGVGDVAFVPLVALFAVAGAKVGAGVIGAGVGGDGVGDEEFEELVACSLRKLAPVKSHVG